MSPASTFSNCGSSSMLVRRSNAPDPGDARIVARRCGTARSPRRSSPCCGTCTCANSRPPRPSRVWRNRTGTPLSSAIAAPTAANTGDSRTSASKDSDHVEHAASCGRARPRRDSTDHGGDAAGVRVDLRLAAQRPAPPRPGATWPPRLRRRSLVLAAMKGARQDDRTRAQPQVLGQHVAPGQQAFVQPCNAAEPETQALAPGRLRQPGPPARAPAVRT